MKLFMHQSCTVSPGPILSQVPAHVTGPVGAGVRGVADATLREALVRQRQMGGALEVQPLQGPQRRREGRATTWMSLPRFSPGSG